MVRSLVELGAADTDEFGGKSATLGDLIGAGIPVPPGFAIATAAFIEFLRVDGLDRRIEATLAGLAAGDVAALTAAAAEIAAAIEAAPLPSSMRAAIEHAYRELGASTDQAEVPVAVRSSARGEDSEEATFAGQQETFLWVRGAEAVIAAVRSCWASLYSAPAISYRSRIAAGGETPAMGVTVQAMVDAAVSGVLFTCSPLDGDPSVIAIDASWGLGLAVVGGEVTPDEFVLNKVTGETLRRTINSKEIRYAAPAGGGPPRPEPVEPELRLAACLEEEQLRRLAALGRQIERQFGRPQDVEWAVPHTEGDKIAVLQARPVTVTREPDTGTAAGGSALSLVMRSFGAGRGAQS